MIWYVALGGAVGSALRFLLSSVVQERSGGPFPLGTLVINISGSLLLGFLLEYALATPVISREVRALLTTGLCGGYTTFSTFSYETIKLAQEGDYRRAGWYLGLSVVVSLLGTVAGLTFAREVLLLRRTL